MFFAVTPPTQNKQGFQRVSDDKPVDISLIPKDDTGLYYKDEPFTASRLHQRLIITYSPKYARYQEAIRSRQVEHAQKILISERQRKNAATRTIRQDLSGL